jgi:hypothetical protein
MMIQKITPQPHVYQVDLSKTSRNGAFPCPNCRARISPDDASELVYSIYEIVVTDNNNIDELVLYCKRCFSFIHLTGFSGIQKTGNSINFEPTKKKDSVHCYVPHI